MTFFFFGLDSNTRGKKWYTKGKFKYYFLSFLSECGTVFILGNQEIALAVRSSVLQDLSSESGDAKLVVSRLLETIQLDQASLEEPDSKAKRQIRCLARKASDCGRLDVFNYLREIAPAGTTGECLSALLIIIFWKGSAFALVPF